MIYRLTLGQPNQEDFIDVLSRGGEATRLLLQPLTLDLSAMGLRQTPKTIQAAQANGHELKSAIHSSIIEAEDTVSPAPIGAVEAHSKPFDPTVSRVESG